jgi:methionine synthase II (cobalamin-independent)
MKRSTDRILTTHMGSPPRPDVADLLVGQAEGEPVDAARIQALTDEAMDYIVRHQLDCGIDVGNDGEMPRHPQVIAERLERAVGDRERVMAGTDCGFGTIDARRRGNREQAALELRR